MCIIIDKPAGATLPVNDIESAAWKNDDGLGYMYISPSTGKLVAERKLFSMGKEREEFTEIWNQLENLHVIYHLRMATHGGVTLENVHPFQVLNKSEHGRDLWFMHNGVIHSMPVTVGKSDTRVFNDLILKPLLSRDPTLLFDQAFQLMLSEVTKGSRLLFMDDLGRIVRTGDWHARGDCIVSNEYSFSYNSRMTGNYGYQAGGRDFTAGKSMTGRSTSGTTTSTGDVTDKVGDEAPGKAGELPFPSASNTSTNSSASTTLATINKTKMQVINEDGEVLEEEIEFDDQYDICGKLVHGDDISMLDLTHMAIDDLHDWIENFPDQVAKVLQDQALEIECLEANMYGPVHYRSKH